MATIAAIIKYTSHIANFKPWISIVAAKVEDPKILVPVAVAPIIALIPGSIFPIEEKPDIIIGKVNNNVELICSNFSQPVNSSLLIVFQIPLRVVPRVTKVVKPFTIS